jgi:CBS domain-containing protein
MTLTVAELLKDKVRQGSDPTLFSVAADSALADAIRTMVEKEISSVLVTDGKKLAGLITLRELLTGLNSHGGALIHAKCRTVMKANPPFAKPDDTVDHLRALMTELHITHVPVMDNDELIGILSFFDIARNAIKDVDFENKLLKQYIRNWPA